MAVKFTYWISNDPDSYSKTHRFTCGIITTNITGYGATEEEAIENAKTKLQNDPVFKKRKFGTLEV